MRSYTFRNSKGTYKGIPIIAANMDTVGTFEMALALHKVNGASRGMCLYLTKRTLGHNLFKCYVSSPPPTLVHSLHHGSQTLLRG